MIPTIQLGGAALPTRELLVFLGIWVALWVVERFGRRRGLPADPLWNAGLLGLVMTFVGARLGYAARHASLYASDPAALLSLSLQSLDWTSGLLLAALTVFLMLRRSGLSLPDVADAALPGLAVFATVAALGALASGDGYGSVAPEVPWAIFLWNDWRHPVQLYEAAGAFTVLCLLGMVWPVAPYPGWISALGLALLAASRLVVESFRGDPATLFGGIRTAQVIDLILLLTALWLLYQGQRRTERAALLSPTEPVEAVGDHGLPGMDTPPEPVPAGIEALAPLPVVEEMSFRKRE